MKLFIDECLSLQLATELNQTGNHDAIHPRDRGRLGEPDHMVLKRCMAEDRVIVTENAIDFRKLMGKEELHPGLIILPAVTRTQSLQLLERALAYLATFGNPDDVMVNRALEVKATGEFDLAPREI